MAGKERIVWIDQLKSLAFYTVILGHMSIGNHLKTWIYSFHMPLFFMISGLNLNIEKVYKTRFSDYAVRLAKKMLVPYMWLQMLSFMLRQLIAFIKDKPVKVMEYLVGIFVGNSNIADAPSNPLYYILLLFLAQIGLWFVIRVAKGNKFATGGLLFALSFGSVFLQRIDLPWHINVVPVAMIFIFAGRLLMDIYISVSEKLVEMNKLFYCIICGVLLVAGYILNRLNGRISIHGNFYGRSFIVFLVCAVASSVAIALFVMLLPKSKLLSFIGTNTLFYMGIHKPLLLVMETIFKEYESHRVFLIIGSLAVFFGLVPVVWVVNRFFPYINGNAPQENTLLLNVGKYLALCATWAVPYLYFNNHFMGGILRENIIFAVLSAVSYFLLMVVLQKLLQTFAPFVFLEKKKMKTTNS